MGLCDVTTVRQLAELWPGLSALDRVGWMLFEGDEPVIADAKISDSGLVYASIDGKPMDVVKWDAEVVRYLNFCDARDNIKSAKDLCVCWGWLAEGVVFSLREGGAVIDEIVGASESSIVFTVEGAEVEVGHDAPVFIIDPGDDLPW